MPHQLPTSLSIGECSIAYGAYYMPSLVYGIPASSLMYKECEDMQHPVVAAILPKMGILRNTARTVVFGPPQYCGLGLNHLAAVQGYIRIQYLLGYLSQCGRANRKSFEVEVANADFYS
jgi:hypothetical protein